MFRFLSFFRVEFFFLRVSIPPCCDIFELKFALIASQCTFGYLTFIFNYAFSMSVLFEYFAHFFVVSLPFVLRKNVVLSILNEERINDKLTILVSN